MQAHQISIPDTAREAMARRERLASVLSQLGPVERAVAVYRWDLWARPEQMPPEGDWITWLILAGRGWGKTRTGAEYIISRVRDGCTRIALVGRTEADTRDVMVEGPSGIIACAPPWMRARYVPSRRCVEFESGARAMMYSADQPDLLRGPEHDTAWVDEFAAFRRAGEVWANLMMGLRRGNDPRVVVTTTPRPISELRRIMDQPMTRITQGSTYDNLAHLPRAFAQEIISRYEGTRLGRQELHAEILDEVPGALWTREMLEETRVERAPDDMRRIVVAIDPAVTSGEDSDDTGIVVAGIDPLGHVYILEDITTHQPAAQWASRALAAYRDWHADRIVAEVNNGGDLVSGVIRQVDPHAPVRPVRATRGKRVRAEPVAAIWEQGRGHIVGHMPALEDQLVGWTPDMPESPDRLDAMVWAVSDLTGRRAIAVAGG